MSSGRGLRDGFIFAEQACALWIEAQASIMLPPLPRRLLVVDDEVGLQKLLVRLAERQGWQVVLAETAAEALALARTAEPGVILLDLHLPDAHGTQVLRDLKTDPRTAHIPVMVWSGSDAGEGEDDAVAAGAMGYVEKTDFRSVMHKLEELLQASEHADPVPSPH